jgi:NAD(P)-dependent dehydrogenase (short-subunit alcohol dehydrogenase family)
MVTGATSGHGRALARILAGLGAEVVLLGRSGSRCRETASEIEGATGHRPDVIVCDLSSRAEVDRAVQAFLEMDRPLHVLVNNAGVVNRERTETVDGHETTFAVNHLAHFQLTLGLLDVLAASAPARILNVASDMHRTVKLDLDDLMLRRGYGPLKAYSVSKLAVVLFTLELARRLEGTGVTANALDPGPVDSHLAHNNPGLTRRLLRLVMRLTFPSPEKAARTAVHLATSQALELESGGYYKWCRLREPSVPRDPLAARTLWEISAHLTGTDL